VEWHLSSVDGRVVTYEFTHPRLGNFGQIVIRPIEGGQCQLDCQYAGDTDQDLVAERRAQLIRLGQYITSVFAQRQREQTASSGQTLRRVQ
jgi:hypothetical protein